MDMDSKVRFAAYIDSSNPDKGAYGGMSFVLFPAHKQPCLIGLVVGTQGLSPDETTLGKPGHARKCQAICGWLNSKYGKGELVAWAKHDPTRTDITIPKELATQWSAYQSAFAKYGKFVYAVYAPTEDRAATRDAVAALLDLFFEERQCAPLAGSKADYDRIRSQWFQHLLPELKSSEVADLLQDRRYVIIQGPPGTGKTKMARDLLVDEYKNNGKSIQFHPSTTYESFIGGLAPTQSASDLGLQFAPKSGALMEAAREAEKCKPKPYLLHVDEINRADLAKVLGEAIYLLEAKEKTPREITLQYDFGEPFHDRLSLPPNLHILGTMNSADRSIAIVDVAVRRRFGFVELWPHFDVVRERGGKLMQDAFERIVEVFIEHASEDAFSLVPGHSYFLEEDDTAAQRRLKTELVPLLEEYLSQGYVGGFAEPIRSYLQWLRSKKG